MEGVSTDTRTLKTGQLFIPLRGPHFDGHEFLSKAIRAGAAACLSEEPFAGSDVPVVMVEDTLKALGDLAVLRQRGRRIIHVHIEDAASGVGSLAASVAT